MEFYVLGEELRMRVGGERAQDVWTAPLQRGVWNDFVVHVKWSSNPSVGFVELFHNGQRVVPARPMATLYPGQGVYVKQGLYRSETIAPQGVLFHDGFTVATALEDVLNAAQPAAQPAAPAPYPSMPLEAATSASALVP